MFTIAAIKKPRKTNLSLNHRRSYNGSVLRHYVLHVFHALLYNTLYRDLGIQGEGRAYLYHTQHRTLRMELLNM